MVIIVLCIFVEPYWLLLQWLLVYPKESAWLNVLCSVDRFLFLNVIETFCFCLGFNIKKNVNKLSFNNFFIKPNFNTVPFMN